MIIKELKLPFPIYPERNRQHRYRKSCRGQIMSGVLTSRDQLPPFQIRVEGVPSPLPTVTEIRIYNTCLQGTGAGEVITDETLVPITDEFGTPLTTEVDTLGAIAYTLSGALATVVELNEGYNVVYNGQDHGETIACGFYEANIILSNGLNFWSEVFQVTEYPGNGMPYVKILWSNANSLQKIYYGEGYQNRLYLDTYLSHSEPQYTEEVAKDGIDTEVVVFSKITSRFIFSEVLPDFLMTALAAMPVCNNINFSDPMAELTMDVTRSRSTSTPEGTGCYSFIEMQLEVDDELFRMACD